MGCPGLCNFISPLRVGVEEFRLVYIHLSSLGMSVLLSLIVFFSLEGICGVRGRRTEAAAV
jgi:hypothetical protein